MSSNFQAVLIDMEEGVVSELLRSPLGEVFDHQQLITDVSGSGNNWLAIVSYIKGLYSEITASVAHKFVGHLKLCVGIITISKKLTVP